MKIYNSRKGKRKGQNYKCFGVLFKYTVLSNVSDLHARFFYSMCACVNFQGYILRFPCSQTHLLG